MDVEIEVLQKVTGEVVEAFGRLLPQLSTSARPLDADALTVIAGAESNSVLIARVGGEIVGTLTLVIFAIPTGVRAWIEDVIVDEAARGQEFGGKRVGEALTAEAIAIARDAGAKTVDLTTRPSRVAAGKLYERLGFVQRDSRVYRYSPS
ncbi:MAG TPA: GNAT family N-acetyltransferase [Streptosporangiaceae bacterium]|nr:GNAT family N-acetyltransferase [Streptosporangiaceae bacterium]